MRLMNQKNKYGRHGQLRRKGYILFLLIAVCCLFGGILARYVHQTRTETSQITAENFYFTVNLLGDTKMLPVEGASQEQYAFSDKSTEGTWNLYGSSEHQIKIQVQNYYDALRVTEKDIVYTGSVSVEKADGTEVKKDNASTFLEIKKADATFSKGTLSADNHSDGDDNNGQSADTLVVDIPSCSNWAYEDGDSVIVKISSTSPYKKTLTMKFVLYTTDTTLRYKVIDSVGSPYAELILMTNVDTAVQPYLKWSQDLSIDNTNPLTFIKRSDGTFEQQPGMENRNMQLSEVLQTGRSESIYFFKTDTSKDYSQSEIIVKPSDDGQYVITVGEQGRIGR